MSDMWPFERTACAIRAAYERIRADALLQIFRPDQIGFLHRYRVFVWRSQN
jgi:hypothetical protein